MIDIIIVKYNNPKYEKECIKSVLKYTNVPYNLIVYENYYKDENLSRIWNKLIKKSDSEYICLLNNDTKVTPKWLEKLLSVFEVKKDAGAVGPITNSAGGLQGGFQEPVNPLGKENIVENNFLSGFCMVFPKKVWEEVGGFDEEFHLYGEDDDFCVRVKNAGYKLYIHLGVWVWHKGSASKEVAEKKGKNIDEIRKISSNLFRIKKQKYA